MRYLRSENADKNNSEYGHFLHSEKYLEIFSLFIDF